jgi:hypothetical protein
MLPLNAAGFLMPTRPDGILTTCSTVDLATS